MAPIPPGQLLPYLQDSSPVQDLAREGPPTLVRPPSPSSLLAGKDGPTKDEHQEAQLLVNQEALLLVNQEAQLLVNQEARLLVNQEAQLIVNQEARLLVDQEARLLVYLRTGCSPTSSFPLAEK